MKFFVYLFICFLFLVPFVLYRRLYFRPLSCLCLTITNGFSYHCVALLPSKNSFNRFLGSSTRVFVHLGSGYVAVFGSSLDRGVINFGDIYTSTDIVILKRNKLGRFVSVDLSDRCLFDILSKFKV